MKQAKFTDEEKERIRAEYEAGGITLAELASKYEVSFSTIKRTIYGDNRKKAEPTTEEETVTAVLPETHTDVLALMAKAMELVIALDDLTVQSVTIQKTPNGVLAAFTFGDTEMRIRKSVRSSQQHSHSDMVEGANKVCIK